MIMYNTKTIWQLLKVAKFKYSMLSLGLPTSEKLANQGCLICSLPQLEVNPILFYYEDSLNFGLIPPE